MASYSISTKEKLIIFILLALSSWEGIISDDDLSLVDEKAPLMKVFGYKPEVHSGSYDHFISQTSQTSHLNFLTAEFETNYTHNLALRSKIKHTPKMGPRKANTSSDYFHSYWTAPSFRNIKTDEL